jgi:hypothetical protein
MALMDFTWDELTLETQQLLASAVFKQVILSSVASYAFHTPLLVSHETAPFYLYLVLVEYIFR